MIIWKRESSSHIFYFHAFFSCLFLTYFLEDTPLPSSSVWSKGNWDVSVLKLMWPLSKQKPCTAVELG